MYNETKTIMKLAKNTSDEKLKEFLNEHYLKEEDEVEETKVEVKETKKEVVEETKKEEVTTKVEEKKETIKDDFKELLKGMTDKITALEEQVKKSNPFGHQAKVAGTNDKPNSFDELFKKFNK